jgi:hypothetical protein
MMSLDKQRGMKGGGWVLLFIIVAVLPASCALDMGMGEDKVGNERNSCSSDADCPAQGSVCDTEMNICVSIPADWDEGNFLVEVIPLDSTGSSSMPSQYFTYNGAADRDEMDEPFILADCIEMKGVVRWTDDDYRGLDSRRDNFGNCIVDAKIELSPAGDFPESQRPVQTMTTGQGASERDGSDLSTFSFVTVPGSYEIKVVPSLDPCGSSGERVLDGSVSRSSGGGLGTGVSVWAVDYYTGDRISSIARIDAENIAAPSGVDPSSFRLYLPPEDAGTGSGDKFYIAISSNELVPQIPTIKLGPYNFSRLDTLNAPAGDGTMDNCADFDAETVPYESQLNLPPIDPRIEFSGSVEGVMDDGSVEPIEGVKVRFFTDDIGGDGTVSGSYELFVTTDIEGKIVTDTDPPQNPFLVPGYYAVSLYPPLGSDYEATRVTSVLIGGTSIQGRTFQLQRKKVLDGLILRLGTGVPIGDVTLEAYPLAPVGSPDGSTVITRYNSTWSDPDGLFSIFLDEGSYKMVFKPSPGSNLPWIWYDGVGVADIIQQHGSAEEPWTISIPDPVIFEGRVLDQAGDAVGGAEVKIYRVVYSSMPDEPPQVRQIAKTSTRTNGGFTAFISTSGGSWQ